MARRGRLPGVRAQSFADADGDGVGDLAGVRSRLPYLARSRHRRDLAQPVLPVSAGRSRVRHRRLLRHRARLRRSATSSTRWSTTARAGRHPDHGWTSSPTTAAPRTRGSGRRLAAAPGWSDARKPVLLPRRSGHRRRRAAQQLAEGNLGGSAWPARRPRPTAHPGSGTSPFRRRASPTSTGTTPTWSRYFDGRPRGSGSTVGSTASASTSRTGSSRTAGASGLRPRAAAGPSTHAATTTDVHDVYRQLAGDRRPVRAGPGARLRRGGVGRRRHATAAAYIRADELHSAFGFELPRPAVVRRWFPRRRGAEPRGGRGRSRTARVRRAPSRGRSTTTTSTAR